MRLSFVFAAAVALFSFTILMAQPRSVSAAPGMCVPASCPHIDSTITTAVIARSTNAATGSNTPSGTLTNLIIQMDAMDANPFFSPTFVGAPGETLILNAPAGWKFTNAGSFDWAPGCPFATATTAIGAGGTQLTVSVLAGPVGACGAGAWTLSGVQVVPLTAATTTGNITLDAASSVLDGTPGHIGSLEMTAGQVMGTLTIAAAVVQNVTATGSISGDVWNNTTVGTKNAGTITLTFPAGTALGDTFTITTTGLTCSAGTATGATLAFAAGTITGTVTAGGAAALGGAITDLTCAVTTNETEAWPHALTTNGGSAVGTWTSRRLMLGWQAGSTTFAAPLNRTMLTTIADPAAVSGGNLCALAADATGAISIGLPVTFTVSLGVVSTATAKSTIVLMGTNGAGCTNYRGGGGVAATDTAIASNSSVNLVSTLPITLTAPAGNTASKLTVGAPGNAAIAPSIFGTAAN